MKSYFSLVLIGTLSLATCIPTATSTPAATLSPSFQQGNTIFVTNTYDWGSGTLRQALTDAQPYDTISFEPTAFPPDGMRIIYLQSVLPPLSKGNLTIDASDSVVVLDGSAITQGENGLTITSNGNIIRGLEIRSFPNAGIAISGGAQYNVIGGDQNIGESAMGQSNLITGNGNYGIGLWDEGTSQNTIQGNYIGVNWGASTVWGHPRDGIHSNGANGNLITGNIIGGNDRGVYLCCTAEGNNTLTNNIIGTDPTGTNHLGNLTAGVLIDRSSYNEIGPGNKIAYNEGAGIQFWDAATRNTVTQNMIRDNNGPAFIAGSFTEPRPIPPTIFESDLQAGTLRGVTCPGCTVEFFSDNSDEGAVYEGQAIAQEDGSFTFDKGTPFTGPSLTATATDLAGTTSRYSSPTTGPNWSLSLQDSKNPPSVTVLQNEPSDELEENRIGSGAEAIHVGNWAWDMGFKLMRIAPDPYGSWQEADREGDEYSVDPQEEQVINDLVDHKIKIMLVLDVWHTENRIVNYKFEEDIALYLKWAKYMANHYKDRVTYYEILNEPDLFPGSPTGISVDDYVKLVKRATLVIQGEDPAAKIVAGALADTRYLDCRGWLWEIAGSDLMPLVDGISWHGMYGAAPSDDPRGIREGGVNQTTEYWENFPSFVTENINRAYSNGFKGEFFDEEMLWRTPAEAETSEPHDFTDMSGAKYYARAVIIHLGLDVYADLAVIPADHRAYSYSVVRSLSTIMAGAQPRALKYLPVEIESKADRIQHYRFELPNGDMLLAIWSDVPATEYDPGVPMTLTFPGFIAESVAGFDVLYGFEQQIEPDYENGHLVLRDLRVKDYPVIYRLTPPY